MPTLDLGQLSVYWERSGRGERLLFISGTGGDLRRQPSVFDGPLGPVFDLLAYDQRGLGQSGVPEGPYSMADYADDAAALLAHVGWDDCLVMGVSFGGMVAQELALRHPKRVRRLVLACTSSGGAGGASIPFTELARLEGIARVERQIELMDTRWTPARRVSHSAEWRAMVEVMGAYLSDDRAPEAARGAALQLEARSRHDTWDRLDRVACPTLVCAGRHDGIAAPENSARMAERIPGAELDLFDGGHQFLWQDRRAFERIIAFLAYPSPRAP
ncbi:MAG: alpha/beta fold hydrolase [Acidimicrobiales bacterium]